MSKIVKHNGVAYLCGQVGVGDTVTEQTMDCLSRVALIGYGAVGGTCVNVGCVPSKAMIRAVETRHAVKSVTRFQSIEAAAKVSDLGGGGCAKASFGR
jgi:pyruvate/2-oxoglutarate dehydrogenase complex dihydrolipoamide dehydrogenase (E3) component